MSHILNSLKGGHIGEYIGEYYHIEKHVKALGNPADTLVHLAQKGMQSPVRVAPGEGVGLQSCDLPG